MIAGKRLTLCVVMACAGLGLALAAQDFAGGPPRDSPQPTGASEVTGVVTDENDRPLRRVEVILTGGGRSQAMHAFSDERGRFTFSKLPLGSFTVSAQKRGYLTAYYGSQRPGRGPARPALLLSPAAPSADISLKVARGAVITGTVADLNGRPAQNVRISLLQYRMNLGERQLVNAPISGPALTDDRGVYRVYGLLPGEYILGAVPVALDALPIGTSDVQWAQQQIRQSQTEPAPSASRPSPAPQPAAMPQAVQYARVFYPGTPDPSGALAITLKAGEERAGVDFVLQYVPSAHVEGTVVGPDGRPRSRPQITVTQPGVPGNVSIGVNWDEANGRFTINGLPPGQYRLTARSNMMPAPAGPLPSAAGSLSSLWGMTDLTLTGTDVSGVTIALRPSLTMTGRMNFESTSQPPEDASNVRILVAPVTNADAGAPAMGTGASDGTFSLPGIVPGRHRLSATGPTLARIGGPPATWLLMSAILNGRDISDRPFDVAPEDSLQNVVLTWSDQPAEISGKLLDASGLPVTDYTVVLFTTDRTFWGLQSRRTLRFPPGPEGQFHFQGLLPGEYYISAVTAVEPEDFADPAFFEQLVNASIKITVTAGEKKVQELRLAGGGN